MFKVPQSILSLYTTQTIYPFFIILSDGTIKSCARWYAIRLSITLITKESKMPFASRQYGRQAGSEVLPLDELS